MFTNEAWIHLSTTMSGSYRVQRPTMNTRQTSHLKGDRTAMALTKRLLRLVGLCAVGGFSLVTAATCNQFGARFFRDDDGDYYYDPYYYCDDYYYYDSCCYYDDYVYVDPYYYGP
jgi:hypothetical protein